METLLTYSALLPLALVLITNLIFLIYGMSVLRTIKVLKNPISGMEYSEITFASAFILTVLIIANAGTPAIFQTYKTYYYSFDNSNWIKLSVIKFGQILLVIFFFQIVYFVLIWFGATLITGSKKLRLELSSGNLPLSLLFSAVVIGFAISIRLCCSVAIDELVPQLLRIN